MEQEAKRQEEEKRQMGELLKKNKDQHEFHKFTLEIGTFLAKHAENEH